MERLKKLNLRASQLVFYGTIVIILVFSALISLTVYQQMRDVALDEAAEKSEILLSHNLAIHNYFAAQLKPAVAQDLKGSTDEEDFDPIWMSSTYAVREIDRAFREYSSFGNYYYKEAAINARSPLNEADEVERAFLQQLNADPKLQKTSSVRVINGVPYFVILLRGETMAESCMQCHSTPDRAPAQLVAQYGGTRSFNRNVGDVVSALSIRIPLSVAYAQVAGNSLKLASLFVSMLLSVFAILYSLNYYMMVRPLNTVRAKVLEIASNKTASGQQIEWPFGLEFRELAEAFNRMSSTLYQHEMEQERMIQKRTEALEQTSHFLEGVLTTIPDQVLVLENQTGMVLYANQEAINFWGIHNLHFGDPINHLLESRQHPEDQRAYDGFWREVERVEDERVIQGQFRMKNIEGEYRWLGWRAMISKRDVHGKPVQTLLIVHDLTEQKEAEQKLIYLSLHDPLTGLYNRARFAEMMRAIECDNVFPISVLMADVDNFKIANDLHGHEAGDELLKLIAQTLKVSLRKDDLVARMGGDEFAAILPHTDANQAMQAKQRIEENMQSALAAYSKENLGLSVGIVTIHNPDALHQALKIADQKMYIEKAVRKEEPA